MDLATNLVGVCQKHRCNMITEDETPICLVCRREEANARTALATAPVAVDPGHDAAMNWRSIAADPQQAPAAVMRLQQAPVGLTFEGRIDAAIEILKSCPMPKDLRQFKVVQKAIQNLENLTKPQEA